MPFYSYSCTNTNCPEKDKVFEILQSISADPLKTCKHCDTDTLTKVVSAPIGFNLIGRGFFKTERNID